MTPERWQKVEELFHLSLEREASQRASFLDEACAGDPDLRGQGRVATGLRRAGVRLPGDARIGD